MKVLITGSSGFIGYHLTKKLLERGNYVLGIDNHSDYYDAYLKKIRCSLLKHKNFRFIQSDINDLNFDEKNIDLAINLAAQPGVRVKKEIQHLYQHSNVEGFKNLCAFCSSQKIKKIIYASSSSVYSDAASGKFNEESTKIQPKSQYGKSKQSNEKFAEKYSTDNDVSFIGLRFFSVYGPFGRPDMAYYSFAKSLLERKKIVLNNDGNMSRDMTYIDDIITGIYGAIEYIEKKKEVVHEIFNLGNDKPIKTKILLNFLEKKLGLSSEIIKNTTFNEAKYTHADIAKAKKILKYQPKIDIEEGLSNFLEWLIDYENSKKT